MFETEAIIAVFVIMTFSWLVSAGTMLFSGWLVDKDYRKM